MSDARLTLGPRLALMGEIDLPGSKSLSNRYLLLAALATGETTLSRVLRSDDTERMIESLRRLGVATDALGPTDFRIRGLGGPFRSETPLLELFLGNAGTAMRPLAAAVAASHGEFQLDGIARMRERPIGDLVDALRPLLPPEGSIRYGLADGYPPLAISARGLLGGTTRIRGNVSSQFLSALLMASPLARERVEIEVVGELISRPYVEITLALMERFGVRVERPSPERFVIEPATYRAPGAIAVEGDASSASYFLAFGALGGPVRVRGCGRSSVQGDARFADVLERMGASVSRDEDSIECRAPASGALRGINADMIDMPDAAMTLAVLALFAQGPTTLRGIGSWRVKETERVVAVRAELEKLGAAVEEGADWIRIQPPPAPREAEIATYDDHRMAMAFSLAAHGPSPVHILEPDCVRKTYPEYFADVRRLRTT